MESNAESIKNRKGLNNNSSINEDSNLIGDRKGSLAFELAIPKMCRDRSISHTFGFNSESLAGMDLGLLIKANPEIPE